MTRRASKFSSGSANGAVGLWSYDATAANQHVFEDFNLVDLSQGSAPSWNLAGLFTEAKAMLRTPLGWFGSLFGKVRAALVPVQVEAKSLSVEVPAGQVWKNYILAGGQRVAMREYTSTNPTGTVYFLLGDHLGSTSVVVNTSTGEVASQIRYSAYGEERFTSGTTPTNYRYTGQLSEMATVGLYFYKARWYDLAISHFTQADTIIPDSNNPTDYDRYSYGRYNPILFSDPTGHDPCTDGTYHSFCPPSNRSGNSVVIVFGGSYTSENINNPGPDPAEQLPAWDWNPWGYDMQYVSYPGSKYEQAKDAEAMGISGSTYLICYSAGTEACLMYAKIRLEGGYEVPSMVLIGPTFSGKDSENGADIGFEGWKNYMDNVIVNGTDTIAVDDFLPLSSETERALSVYKPPEISSGNYKYIPSIYAHYDTGGFPTGSNNNPISVASTYSWMLILSFLP